MGEAELGVEEVGEALAERDAEDWDGVIVGLSYKQTNTQLHIISYSVKD